MILSHRVHVLGKREELDSVRLPGAVAIVLDILFATSTMVAALANGATEVIPVMDGAAASAEAARHAPGSFVLAGELDAITLQGFAKPTPLALIALGLAGRKLILSTTNGTIALHDASAAAHVYAASLLNGSAVIEHVLAAHAGQPILIVCAGSANNFNLEDFYGAGYLVELLTERLGGEADFSDAARAARAVYRHGSPVETLLDARVGRMMIERGATDEVRYIAQLSAFDVVPRFVDGRLVAV
ncbi:MAG: 2-phosphosulfolactate phosphatase [Betaproteobacteria bacterium]|nr:2-phosphosulfolactate phosphatase [Betaproteobacteria bacterium]